jgi:hypothetical protein
MQNKQDVSYSANFIRGSFGFLLASLLSWFVYLFDAYRSIKQRLVSWQRKTQSDTGNAMSVEKITY